MEKLGLIAGFVAVALFLLGYLQKDRAKIIALNLASRALCIVQYVLVGALAGAVLDIAGAISTFFAQNIERPAYKKHKPLIFIINNIVLIGIGILMYKNIFSIFLILGVTLQTDALWLKNEKHVRLISLLCCPFCFTYNLTSGAIGSAIGDTLAFCSLIYSTVRYDLHPTKKTRTDKEQKN